MKTQALKKAEHALKLPTFIEKFFSPKKFHKDTDFLPSVNITDNKNSYKLDIALPGMRKKDINIEIKNNCLIISSEKKSEKKRKFKNQIRQEYTYSRFQRIFELPPDADENYIKAKFKNGILQIRIKKDKTTEKQVQIIDIE